MNIYEQQALWAAQQSFLQNQFAGLGGLGSMVPSTFAVGVMGPNPHAAHMPKEVPTNNTNATPNPVLLLLEDL